MRPSPLVRQGVKPELHENDRQGWLHASSPPIVTSYNIVSESDLRAGVDRLAAYVKKLPKETKKRKR